MFLSTEERVLSCVLGNTDSHRRPPWVCLVTGTADVRSQRDTGTFSAPWLPCPCKYFYAGGPSLSVLMSGVIKIAQKVVDVVFVCSVLSRWLCVAWFCGLLCLKLSIFLSPDCILRWLAPLRRALAALSNKNLGESQMHTGVIDRIR